MISDDLDGSCPPFLRMVTQEDVGASNDHEGLGCVTEPTKDPAQGAKQDPPALCVFQQNAKAGQGCDAV